MVKKYKHTLEQSNVKGEALNQENWINEHLDKEEIEFLRKLFNNTGDKV